MPSINDWYKHKQIIDVYYYVKDVDKNAKVAYLSTTKRNEKPFPVTFDQLESSYERVR